MTLHHHITSGNLEDVCPYCGREIHEEPWNSEFNIEDHYKCHKCKCGKKVCIKVDFHGSGHDSWREETNIKKINSLDNLKESA